MYRELTLAAALMAAAGCGSQQASRDDDTTPSARAQAVPADAEADYVGRAGPAGPAGPAGAQGPTGSTGEPGYAAAGPRGATGASGAAGSQGPTGATGAAGTFVRGPDGAAGPAGPAGAQGPAGQTGARGASTSDGIAGPTGAAGATGARGPAGQTGAQGPTTVGPAGPAGRPGISGPQGTAGERGGQGTTTAGVAGAAGPAGPTGVQGEAGPTGPQGLAGALNRWVSYRDFWFDPDQAVIHDADADRVAEIAAYMKANPSIQLGIDGSTNPRSTNQRDQDLRDSRVKAVRDSLIASGVSADRISSGMFGPVDLRRDGRVEVLIKTDTLAQARIASIGPTDVGDRWTSYRDFWFDGDQSFIHNSDAQHVAEIAAYMKANPSIQLGIDGSTNPRATERRDLDMRDRRVKLIRDALTDAGVPASRISDGMIGNVDLRRDGRVEVLIKTDRLAQARLGSAGPTGVVEHWNSYRDFMFDADRAEIRPADATKLADIAAHMKRNPSLYVGIDCSVDPNGADQPNPDLAKRRGDAVRDALIDAGVPASRIQCGEFGDTRSRRDRRVEVLVSMGNK